MGTVTGEQYLLEGGGLTGNGASSVTATVTELAAGLRQLTVNGVDLIQSYPADRTAPYGAGLVLVPWPNRVANATWTLDGKRMLLDVTEPDAGNAIHGLLRNTGYRVTERDAHAVTLSARIFPQHGYPFLLDTAVRYQLSADGVRVTHRIRNESAAAAPVAVGAHPYLRLGEVPTADLLLTVDAASYFEVDARQIPVAERPVDGTAFDLRQGRRVGDLALDHGFAQLRLRDGHFRHRLTAPDGSAVELWAEEDFAYLQAFVLPHFAGEDGPTLAVAIEPMTAPANALNTGRGLRWLEPQEEWVIGWGIRHLPRATPGIGRSHAGSFPE